MELKLFIKCHFTVVVTYEDAVSAQFSLASGKLSEEHVIGVCAFSLCPSKICIDVLFSFPVQKKWLFGW